MLAAVISAILHISARLGITARGQLLTRLKSARMALFPNEEFVSVWSALLASFIVTYDFASRPGQTHRSFDAHYAEKPRRLCPDGIPHGNSNGAGAQIMRHCS